MSLSSISRQHLGSAAGQFRPLEAAPNVLPSQSSRPFFPPELEFHFFPIDTDRACRPLPLNPRFFRFNLGLEHHPQDFRVPPLDLLHSFLTP